MTDQLDEIIAKITEVIKGHDTRGRELANDPYQEGIQTASDYTTGKVLLNAKKTHVFLEIFGGNPEIALRVLRERLDQEAAQLLPEGADGLTLLFEDWPIGSKKLALYTTPLYDTWYNQYYRSRVV